MLYEIDENDIIHLARQCYEAGLTGYSDLKEATCISLLTNFLANKKRITPITNLVLNSNIQATENMTFSSDVYTITDRVYTNN